MGSALARASAAGGAEVIAVARNLPIARARVSGAAVEVVGEMPDSSAWRPDLVILAVKPQSLRDAAPGMEPGTAGALLLSVAAGVSLATLAEVFPRARAIVRAMPNLPVAEGQGMTTLCGGSGVAAADVETVQGLLAASGRLAWVETEDELDVATAVAGSGPAYFLSLAEALRAAAEARGISPEIAALLAEQTLIGSASLLGRGMRPLELAQQVVSPGGTTAAGLAVLDGDRALSTLVCRTVGAATARARELRALAS
jgi:pyrroline-5-carboxylate reductase